MLRLVITRPREQSSAWLAALRAEGVMADALPLIDIAAVDDPTPLREAGQALRPGSFAMFVSANAVQHFFAAQPPTWTWPGGCRAGATGPGTVQALLRAGVPRGEIDAPADDAPRWDSEALWARIAGQSWQGRPVLVVRGEDGRDWLAERWREQGADLQFLAAYRRGAPNWSEGEQQLWTQLRQEPQRLLWHFSASEAVYHLAARHAGWPQSSALATHERIAQAARALGLAHVSVIAATPQAAAAAWRAACAGRSVQSRQP